MKENTPGSKKLSPLDAEIEKRIEMARNIRAKIRQGLDLTPAEEAFRDERARENKRDDNPKNWN